MQGMLTVFESTHHVVLVRDMLHFQMSKQEKETLKEHKQADKPDDGQIWDAEMIRNERMEEARQNKYK